MFDIFKIHKTDDGKSVLIFYLDGDFYSVDPRDLNKIYPLNEKDFVKFKTLEQLIKDYPNDFNLGSVIREINKE